MREQRGANHLLAVLADAGAVLGMWAVASYLETTAVSAIYRPYFAGSWETSIARRQVLPIAIASLVPAAFAVVALARCACGKGSHGPHVLAVAAGAFGGLTAYGVSFGRHMHSWFVRGPFIVVVALAAGGLAFAGTPRAVRAARECSGPRLFLVSALLALTLWCANAFVLPRLYPAFHWALLVATLAALAFAAVPICRGPLVAVEVAVRALSLLCLVASFACVARAPAAAVTLAAADNLRLILMERAPLLGPAVRVANLLRPPLPLDETGDEASTTASSRVPDAAPSLDWSGHDIVLLTVDALRADHVSAYGYARATTPVLDALAREGAVFDAAYCPTPHTSYSVTSLMTGKYMRPLLALGRGDDSETWASLLRRYGYRTAAFYPPAVFFIDEDRFSQFRDRGLDFEYRKVEFAGPELRASQLDAYLGKASFRDLSADTSIGVRETDKETSTSVQSRGGDGRPLFLWVHFFEPHEPYVGHAEHLFGDPARQTDIDAYDSEIAASDRGVGAVVARVHARRPGAVIIVTADHGEEFGEHGGRYHGTTVYEEQVHVPLVVVGPGVAPGHVTTVVQTVDILPTVLSALHIPRPARVRGRDLGAEATHGNSRASPLLKPMSTPSWLAARCGSSARESSQRVPSTSPPKIPSSRGTSLWPTKTSRANSARRALALPASTENTKRLWGTSFPRRFGAECRAMSMPPWRSRRCSTTRARAFAARPRK
jgi:hypothetical protein